ncbi:uncharacterized protein LOC144664046 [Oculina patagonica]
MFSPQSTDGASYCKSALGMQSKGIPNANISASSTLSTNHAPAFARLDERRGAWCSAPNDNSPYVEILLDEEQLITKVVTQGSYKDLLWATKYQIKYLKEGKWTTYQKADGSLTFKGNRGSYSLNDINLQPPIRTSSIRIYPMVPLSMMTNDDNVVCLRLELYGCSVPSCGPPNIPDNSELRGSNKASYKYSDKVLLRCKAGYFARGNGLRTCGLEGWIGPSFTCFTHDGNFVCDGQTINMCQKHLTSWKVARLGGDSLQLYKCEGRQLQVGDKLLLFVSRAKLYNYGKYELVTVKRVTLLPDQKWTSVCQITLAKPILMYLEEDDHTFVLAQRFPTFGEVSLRNKCVLTCDKQKDGLGGILAFGAGRLLIDETSKIDMSGKGFSGGDGGDKRGGGGYGGETFISPQLQQSTMGKGGDVYNAPWAKNRDGIGGGGAADGPRRATGYKGGRGGYNAGGGGADSTVNSDDGAAGGGGGGHFSGGGGGGGGSGCGHQDGGKGGVVVGIGTFAGGGGRSSCPGSNGGNGGKAGGAAGSCYDNSAAGGNAGSANRGGGGGDSCGNHYGAGGGGGGLQFGNTDFKSRLSYGGGGGGGGGSAFSDDPYPGGRGGNGGGLVYLQLDELTLNGTIAANGQPGQCLNKKAHRSAPGGSGAGGSVVIFTKKLHGDIRGKISASGGSPVKCAFGTGGGGGGGVGRWVVQENQEQPIVHQGSSVTNLETFG